MRILNVLRGSETKSTGREARVPRLPLRAAQEREKLREHDLALAHAEEVEKGSDRLGDQLRDLYRQEQLSHSE